MSDRKVAIVTGASSGIGLETALELARRGYALALAARRADRLADVAERCRAELERAGGLTREQAADSVLIVPTDVSVEEQVYALVGRVERTFGRIDVMVNNAGYGHFALAHETETADMRRIFEVNFYGVFWGCRAVAPIMIRQRSGHIFNVSSVIGKRGSPFHGAYSATKFAIVGLDDAMRVELRPQGVRVTTVCPALTETEFFQHSRAGQKAQSSFQKIKGMTKPDVIARGIVGAIGRNKPELVFTVGGKFLILLNALCPKLADRLMKVYHDDLAKQLAE